MQLREVKKYHDNGNLWVYYFLDDHGEVHGKYVEYFGDGKISYEYTYNHGELHGKYFEYYDNGDIDYIVYYWYGKEVTKAEFLKLKYDEVMKCS